MMKKISNLVGVAFLTCLLLTPKTWAHGDAPSKIQGAEVNLVERNHAFAGEILGNPIFGVFNERTATSTVQLRHNGKTISLTIGEIGHQYGGNLSDFITDREKGEIQSTTTEIRFLGAEKTGPTTGRIALSIDQNVVPIQVTGQSFENGHFQHPKFEATFNGKSVSFEFSGEACFSYSANLAMMIFGSFSHLLK
ncbi:MAG: hypothetical protein ABIQ95_09385 [Bdellovibrionia bacterium]